LPQAGAAATLARVSYLHCPSCAHAYNLEREPACPHCRAPAHPPAARLVPSRDAVADIVIAATQLARALARATPAERQAARASLGLVHDRVTAAIGRARFAGFGELARLPRLLGAAAAVLLPVAV
jgi:hypothetical protein